MARKCEVITGESVYNLEEKINKWLGFNEKVEILFFECQKIYDHWHAAYILYDDSPIIPPIPNSRMVSYAKAHPENSFYVPTPPGEAKPG